MSDTTLTARSAPDRFWAYMGTLFAVLAVIGFAPNSVAILIGAMDNPPLIVHVHAAMMVAWIVLVATQSHLVAAGNVRLHQRLGKTAFLLGPVILFFLIGLAITFLPDGAGRNVIALLQTRRGVLFTVFLTWGLWLRRRDGAAHKRLMLFSMLVFLDAAISRMSWLPSLGLPHPFIASQVYLLLLFVPFFVRDRAELGRPHVTTVVAFTGMLVSSLGIAALL